MTGKRPKREGHCPFGVGIKRKTERFGKKQKET